MGGDGGSHALLDRGINLSHWLLRGDGKRKRAHRKSGLKGRKMGEESSCQ